MKEVWLNHNCLDIIERDLCEMINKGKIRTATHQKKIGKLFELFAWLRHKIEYDKLEEELNKKKQSKNKEALG